MHEFQIIERDLGKLSNFVSQDRSLGEGVVGVVGGKSWKSGGKFSNK